MVLQADAPDLLAALKQQGISEQIALLELKRAGAAAGADDTAGGVELAALSEVRLCVCAFGHPLYS